MQICYLQVTQLTISISILYAFISSTFLYARLKNGRIMLYPLASVRPSVNFFVSV